ncbi:MAG: amidase family protein [Oscillospiraceae bacterium]|nr:amidase family protein [Oscillospiraceae bacterium]
MTISQMINAMHGGFLTSAELVSRYISEIGKNKHLNAVIELNPNAYAIAECRDVADDKRGVLHGIPVLIKDNINTGDRMRTSAGSVALAENIAPEDAPIVRLLREAGAVILGKTNMTEFANYMTDGTMPNGYSSRGGQTLNLFDREADPSGSSTGSAVAVAADLCAAAVGTETSGSIISPAQHAGIVGIKPTIGLINGGGIIPISFTLDTPGPMGRCVDDAGLLLSVLTGRKYEKPQETMLKGIRIGICRMFTDGINAEWLNANERLIGVMCELGVDCIELPEHDIRAGFLYPIAMHEFKYGINRYLRSMNNPDIPQSLQEIIEYNERHSDIALKYGQDNFVDANNNTSGAMTEPEYMAALAARDVAVAAFDTLFVEHRIDVFFMLAANSGLAAATGFPSMTIPIGKTTKGLPIGSFFVARRYGEKVLLKVTGAIENANKSGSWVM